MKKLFVELLVLLTITLVALVACASSGTLATYSYNLIPVEEECYRVYLSESGVSIEGYAIERPESTKAGNFGTFILETRDGIATIPNRVEYVDATEKIDCSVLGYERK